MGYTKKRWYSQGKSCPLCNEMNGSIVVSGDAFMEQGDSLSPEGVNPYQAKRTILTPPLHGGCDCIVMPEV